MKLAPSLLAADLSRLYDEAREVADLVELLHFDVMDGHFVPNLTFGPPLVNALRAKLSTPFDTHLMIAEPARYARELKLLPGDAVSFHLEAVRDPLNTLRELRKLGARAGLAIKPATPADAVMPLLAHLDYVLVMTVEPGFSGQLFLSDMLSKIRDLDRVIAESRLPVEIEADGGINGSNIRQLAEAGADIAVAASAIFGTADRRAAIASLRHQLGK